MMMKNETAIITGSTSGIGKKLAEIFLSEGCRVVICSRSEDKVKQTLSELNEKYNNAVIGFPCDVTDPKDLKILVDKTVEAFGSIRILVANAGINLKYGPFEYLSPENVNSDAKTIIGANLIGMMNSISAVLPQMKNQGYGRIITVSGGGADRPVSNMTIYSASKGGVAAFSNCLAEELKESKFDIKLNIFLPGMIKTGLTTAPEIVPGWSNVDKIREETDIVLKYIGADIDKSCSKVIPFVLPSCKENGKSFRGFSLFKLIRGAMKMQKVLKNMNE